MPSIISSERLPIKLWLDDIDDGALQQARNLANLPFAFHHIAVMPDAHLGYGMPIGGILAARDAVLPNGVGVDIGCGICAVKTSLVDIEQDELKQIIKLIKATVPLGFKHHKNLLPLEFMPESSIKIDEKEMPIVAREYQSARTQIGTLGGGNHFIEIQRGQDGAFWFMVHSGSRNLGFKVAEYYHRLAVDLNGRWKSQVPKSWQLAFLPIDSREGRKYLAEMNYCVLFAHASRRAMCRQVEAALIETVSNTVTFEEPINIAHNYAALETHFGEKVVVHRKGATRALAGESGIIPGSQGSTSYIVQGRGNPESFCSCSHGAGRKLGRKQAVKQLDLVTEKRHLERKGILHALKSRRDLEEAAGAYKDIEEVIARQSDLVDVIEMLEPRAVIKG